MNTSGKVLKWLCKGDDHLYMGDPVFSPDGRQVAFFASTRDTYWNLYLMDLGSGAVRRLTFTPYLDSNPAFSSDGKRLYFVRHKNVYRGDGVLFDRGDIYNLDLGSGAEHRVTHQEHTSLRTLHILPDGKSAIVKLKTTEYRKQGQSLWKVNLDQPQQMQPVNLGLSDFSEDPRTEGSDFVDDKNAKYGFRIDNFKFIEIENPALSRDGRYLAFTWSNPEVPSSLASYQLYVTDLQENETNKITNMKYGAYVKGISPKGNQIWFATLRSHLDFGEAFFRHSHLWRINRDGTGLTHLSLDFRGVADQKPLFSRKEYEKLDPKGKIPEKIKEDLP
jgi:Tol biopolymer transport system component